MKEENNSIQIPNDYQICLNHQCPKASTCLRQIVEQEISDSVKYWVVISPKHLATLNGECPYYRSNVKVRYAKGFIGILNNLPFKQRQSIILLIINTFSQRTYYRIRKGERLLSPTEQQMILKIIKSCGISNTYHFDAYTEEYEW